MQLLKELPRHENKSLKCLAEHVQVKPIYGNVNYVYWSYNTVAKKKKKYTLNTRA